MSDKHSVTVITVGTKSFFTIILSVEYSSLFQEKNAYSTLKMAGFTD